MHGVCAGLVDAVRISLTASLVCLNLGLISLEDHPTCEAIFWNCRHTTRFCPDNCVYVGLDNNDACIVVAAEVGMVLSDCVTGGCWTCPESAKCAGRLHFGTNPSKPRGTPCTCDTGC